MPNLIDPQSIDAYLDRFLPSDPKASKLLNQALRKILSSRPENLRELTACPEDAPTWLKAKWPEGGPYHRFAPDTELDIKVRHVADWIAVAVNDRDPWIDRVDAGSKDKKPFRLSGIQKLEDATHEADKDMRERNRRVAGKLTPVGEGEVTVKELDNGFRIVRLTTLESLDREGVAMGHCVGQGAYDKSLVDGSREFFSLRDRSNQPHSTIEVDTREHAVLQCQGKENKPPVSRYLPHLQKFLTEGRYRLVALANRTGLIENDGEYFSIHAIPPGLKVAGDVDLSGTDITELPRGLEVGGKLDLQDSGITRLPDGLKVGSLDLRGTPITELPRGIKVREILGLRNSKTTTKPVNDQSIQNAPTGKINTQAAVEIADGGSGSGNSKSTQAPGETTPGGTGTGNDVPHSRANAPLIGGITPPDVHANTQARMGAGGNAVGLGMDIKAGIEAFQRNDMAGVRDSALSGSLNGGSLIADGLGQGASTSAKYLGAAGYGAMAINTGKQVAILGYEDGIDRKAQQSELVRDTLVGVGAGIAVGGTVTAVVATGTTAAITAAGLTGAAAVTAGVVGGVVATGGTILIAAAATAAVAAANHGMDRATGGAIYDAEAKRFGPNLAQKTHMIGHASAKFNKELADPKTGKIDWTNMETVNKYSALLVREKDQLEQKVKDNSSYGPRWARGMIGSKRLETEVEARTDLKIVESAQAEVNQHIKELQAIKIAEQQAEQQQKANVAKINGLASNAKEGVTEADLLALGEKWIRNKLGDKELADRYIEHLKKSGLPLAEEGKLPAEQQQKINVAKIDSLASDPKVGVTEADLLALGEKGIRDKLGDKALSDRYIDHVKKSGVALTEEGKPKEVAAVKPAEPAPEKKLDKEQAALEKMLTSEVSPRSMTPVGATGKGDQVVASTDTKVQTHLQAGAEKNKPQQFAVTQVAKNEIEVASTMKGLPTQQKTAHAV